MQYLKTAKAGDDSQGELSRYVNFLKSPEGGREAMGEFEKYCKEQGRRENLLENIKAIMQNAKLSAEDAMKLLNISPEEQKKLLPLL